MSDLTRREFLQASALAAAALSFPTMTSAQTSPARATGTNATGTKLNWLDGASPTRCDGVTWGVAWPRGQFKPGQAFNLETEKGELPLQSWPLATWPDGSLKWSAHALGPQQNWPAKLQLTPTATQDAKGLEVSESAQEIVVATGLITCHIAKSGHEIFSSLERQGQVVARAGKLICLKSNEADTYSRPAEFTGHITGATLENSGPLRAVVRLEGKHQNGRREWLPFTLRLYFYAGSEAIRIVHSFVFDGEAQHDFIRGLSVRFSVPMRDELYNRHIRLVSSEGGLWGEGIQNITGLRRDPGEAVRAAQVEGQPTPPLDSWSEPVRRDLEFVPAWGDFSLTQLSSDGFQIRKRTKAGQSWVAAANGKRAAGVGYVGGVSGGVAFGMRNFWQKFPAQIDVSGAASNTAQVDLWLYSPDAPPMDLRLYHDGMGMDDFKKQLRGLDITYEDYEPGFNSPYGVARTSEMNLWVTGATPSRQELVDFATSVHNPPLLVATPEQFLSAQVFGALWSLTDSSTPAKARIEAQNDHLLSLFPQQREQHGWYGFWDYGDWMHSYDADRHVWKYDVGGFAWANAELSPELWLWYSFLRSGRSDVFRLAEAMTRHTSEVDVHHIGRFAGLGSRHNVQHWGDSSKQPRVSNAAYKRFFYFLTADERTGDLLHELLQSDRAVTAVDVGRKLGDSAEEETNADRPATMALGTSWCSIVAAWLTEWERTGDTKWRDRIETGMRGIAAMPRGWFTGNGDYDFATGALTSTTHNFGVSHLSAVFGAVEVNAELFQLCDVPAYRAAWLQYCRLYNAPGEEQQRELGTTLKRTSLRQAHSRLTAFAAHINHDPALGARAWAEFNGKGEMPVSTDFKERHFSGVSTLNPVDESLGMSTNSASQWGLAAIQNLALAGEWLPTAT